MGLRINEEKITYMKMTPRQVKRYLHDITIDVFKFKELTASSKWDQF
jgi:hypothetical protein